MASKSIIMNNNNFNNKKQEPFNAHSMMSRTFSEYDFEEIFKQSVGDDSDHQSTHQVAGGMFSGVTDGSQFGNMPPLPYAGLLHSRWSPPSLPVSSTLGGLLLQRKTIMISSSSSSSDEDADDNDMMMFMYLKKHTKLFIDQKPCRTSILGGKEYLRELVCGNPIQCYELFRMKQHVCLNLCDKLKLLGLLQDSRNVSVEEGLAMTLRILCHGNTQREVSDRFQHSTATVHYWFKTVLRALKAFALTVVKPVDRGAVQPEILANSRWYPFFKMVDRSVPPKADF